MQTGSPSHDPAMTGFVVLMLTPHETGRETWLWLTVAYHAPVPVVIAGVETCVVLWNLRFATTAVYALLSAKYASSAVTRLSEAR